MRHSAVQIYLTTLPDPIPAPHGVQYSASDGVLRWSPPHTEEVLDSSNISVDLKITHYIIYVTDLQTGLLIANFNTTGPETNITIFGAMSYVPCSMSIQVSAVNPAGEGQRSKYITNNRKKNIIIIILSECMHVQSLILF